MLASDCPCRAAGRNEWTEWEAQYAPELGSTRMLWQGNTCTRCGEDVTEASKGAPDR